MAAFLRYVACRRQGDGGSTDDKPIENIKIESEIPGTLPDTGKSKKADNKKPMQQPLQKPVEDKTKKPVKPKTVNDY